MSRRTLTLALFTSIALLSAQSAFAQPADSSGSSSSSSSSGSGQPAPKVKGFLKLDKDGNGTVSLAEFTGPLEALFLKRDADKDGSLSSDEFKRKRLAEKLDADKNGEVSKEEFLKRATEEFKKLDTDADGNIGGTELPPKGIKPWKKLGGNIGKSHETGEDEGTEATEGRPKCGRMAAPPPSGGEGAAIPDSPAVPPSEPIIIR